uniref:G-protein coupled receptors family 1 profile domain-containing protein n=1 Tax=Ascaris lumbricoides TaxID=6252 RepID=A0A0M3HJA8_ASCLU
MNAACSSVICMTRYAASKFLSINIDISCWMKRLYAINGILLLLCIYGPQIFQ